MRLLLDCTLPHEERKRLQAGELKETQAHTFSMGKNSCLFRVLFQCVYRDACATQAAVRFENLPPQLVFAARVGNLLCATKFCSPRKCPSASQQFAPPVVGLRERSEIRYVHPFVFWRNANPN